MKPVCFYHANCLDGFGAATIVYGAKGADLHPVRYGHDPLWSAIWEGRDVFIVDFSFPADVLNKIAAKAWPGIVTVIDHHKTAKELESAPLSPNVRLYLDTSNERYSGVGLTWRYFFGDLQMDMLYQHIQDRDLWKFNLPDTKAVTAALFTYDHDLLIWAKLFSEVPRLKQEGKALLRKQERDVRALAKQAYMGQLAGYTVPFCNANFMFSSELGAVLSKGQPFAVVYAFDGKEYSLSLRSQEDGVDVAEIAKIFGGGGHKNAAGCKVSADQFRSISG